MSMNNLIQKYFLLLAISLITNMAAIAAPMQLSAPQAGDLVTTQLAPVDSVTPLQNTRQETVQFSWAIGNNIDIETPHKSHLGESRGYWMLVSDIELTKGVDIYTTAPGSIVKVSPQSGSIPIDPVDMELRGKSGTSYHGNEAMDLIVGNDQLESSGAPFPRGTSVFRIAAKRGQGHFTLHAPNLTPTGQQRYHIYVEETNSDVILQIQADNNAYLYGQALNVSSSLKNSQKSLPIQNMKGFIRSPDGVVTPISFKRENEGVFSVSKPLDQPGAITPGLWEVHTQVQGMLNGTPVRRNVKTAFSYIMPQARLTGELNLETPAGGDLSATLSVDVQSASRYELKATLYGTDANGKQQAFMVANTASWLNPGENTLQLVFDSKLLKQSNLSPPYEVRDLRLMDQSRMGVLHRQAYGFTAAR